ncbi:hypothetical protein L1887_50552 [Cichorium endivia]|nr:hypothetical protein L1887_50552 [Cichorium endivia]
MLKQDMSAFVPNTNGTIVATYPARVYCGQYSQDSSFFYTCTQDFRVHMYDTTVRGTSQRAGARRRAEARAQQLVLQLHGHHALHVAAADQEHPGPTGANWTITDAHLSPDNQWDDLLEHHARSSTSCPPSRRSRRAAARPATTRSCSISPIRMMDTGVRWRSAIWSIRFSGDSREIVAGAHFGDIYVYDIEARRRVLRVEGHSDDVNAVAFADAASSNVLISGSDDSFVKVWDRRSLSGGKTGGRIDGSAKFERMTHLDYGTAQLGLPQHVVSTAALPGASAGLFCAGSVAGAPVVRGEKDPANQVHAYKAPGTADDDDESEDDDLGRLPASGDCIGSVSSTSTVVQAQASATPWGLRQPTPRRVEGRAGSQVEVTEARAAAQHAPYETTGPNATMTLDDIREQNHPRGPGTGKDTAWAKISGLDGDEKRPTFVAGFQCGKERARRCGSGSGPAGEFDDKAGRQTDELHEVVEAELGGGQRCPGWCGCA